MYLNTITNYGFVDYKGLTLTWDVFKYFYKSISSSKSRGLTLTWDVFKCNFWFNSNIVLFCLTLTWDVFK